MPDDPHPLAADIGLTDGQAATVRRIIAAVLPDAEFWVFGSRATGRARPFSDLDLLFTRPAELSWSQRSALSQAFEASDLPFSVDVVGAAELSGTIADRVNGERRAL